MIEKTCSQKYVDPKMDRTPNAYFSMWAYVWGNSIPCFKHKFREVFNVGPFVVLSKSGLLTPTSLYQRCRPVRFQGQADFTPVDVDMFSRDGSMSRGAILKVSVFFFSLSELNKSFPKYSLYFDDARCK